MSLALLCARCLPQPWLHQELGEGAELWDAGRAEGRWDPREAQVTVPVRLLRYRNTSGMEQAGQKGKPRGLAGQVGWYLFYLQRLKVFLRYSAGKQRLETALAWGREPQRGCLLQGNEKSGFRSTRRCFPLFMVSPRSASRHLPPEQHRGASSSLPLPGAT